MSSFIDINCGVCGQPVKVGADQPHLANLPGVSMMVMRHDVTVGCPHCRATLALELIAVPQWMLRTVKVEQPQAPLVVLPENGRRN